MALQPGLGILPFRYFQRINYRSFASPSDWAALREADVSGPFSRLQEFFNFKTRRRYENEDEKSP